jgi:hypothetical protein
MSRSGKVRMSACLPHVPNDLPPKSFVLSELIVFYRSLNKSVGLHATEILLAELIFAQQAKMFSLACSEESTIRVFRLREANSFNVFTHCSRSILKHIRNKVEKNASVSFALCAFPSVITPLSYTPQHH